MTFPMYLDENVDLEVALRLRRDGYDVLTAQEAGLAGSSDEVQLTYALEQGRVLFTHDLRTFPPLLQEWWRTGGVHAGVILCHREQPERIHEGLRALLETYGEEHLRNTTLWLPRVGPAP